MPKFLKFVVVLAAWLFLLSLVTARGQEKPNANDNPKLDTRDLKISQQAPTERELTDVSEWLNVVKVAAQISTGECNKLESTQLTVKLRDDYQKRIEARLPGYTVNWQTWTIIKR